MRAFIEVAKTNPKVYAELFFYKSIREANDIEYGYDDQRYANGYVREFNANNSSNRFLWIYAPTHTHTPYLFLRTKW